MTAIRPRICALVLAVGLAVSGVAHAEEAERGALTPGDAGYYYDTSALVTYGALGGYLAVTLLMEPPEKPRFFAVPAAPEEYRGDTLPNWTISLFASPTLAVVLLADTDARWYQTKGAISAFATTVFLTEFTKNFAGRHRPDYDPTHPEAGGPDGRKSFFSGHSSLTLVSTTYLAWFLHGELFPTLRKPDGAMRWWEPLAYLGLAGVSVGVPVSRVIDNRHNPSDVLVGSLVGASVATGFYFWHRQQARRAGIGKHRESAHAGSTPRRGWLVMPSAYPAGASALLRF